MITKVLYSKNPAATINYVMNQKKKAEIYLSKGISSLFDVKRIIKDFETQSALHPTLEVKAVHIPMSFHVWDTAILNEHDSEILQDWIDRMESHGYRFDQYLIARHHDKDHKNPHWHLVGNVVQNDGSRANLANIGEAAREASIFVTEKWGLTSAKHEKQEMIAELNQTLHEYSQQEFISNDQANTDSTWDDNASEKETVDGDSSFPTFTDGTLDITGIVTSILFPETAPALSSGGGGGSNDDDEDKKKKNRNGMKGGHKI